MNNFFHKFNTKQELDDANLDISLPHVSYIEREDYVEYCTDSVFVNEPLTFKIISGGTIKWFASDSSLKRTISYKKNDGAYTSITSDVSPNTPKIDVEEGDIIQFFGNNTEYSDYYNNRTRTNIFGGSAVFNVYGNISSLIHGNNYKNYKDETFRQYAFFGLFTNCNVVSAENLVLPAMSVGASCYREMFFDCSMLIKAPKLPAIVLSDSCYRSMFICCYSLKEAPALPATTLADYCYSNMFNGCESLIKAPELPSMILSKGCYSFMFGSCTSLTEAPYLPATTLAENCYEEMFDYCESLTDVQDVLPALTLCAMSYNMMFYCCYNLTTAPTLPASFVPNGCYSAMFEGCSSLNEIECLATDFDGNSCVTDFTCDVSSSGNFIKHPNMSGWTSGNNGIPSNWSVKNISLVPEYINVDNFELDKERSKYIYDIIHADILRGEANSESDWFRKFADEEITYCSDWHLEETGFTFSGKTYCVYMEWDSESLFGLVPEEKANWFTLFQNSIQYDYRNYENCYSPFDFVFQNDLSGNVYEDLRTINRPKTRSMVRIPKGY